MTRRDFCSECGEMVADMDVCCDECGKSYCSECTDGYDPRSRFYLLRAQWHSNNYFTFKLGQLQQFEKDYPFLVPVGQRRRNRSRFFFMN